MLYSLNRLRVFEAIFWIWFFFVTYTIIQSITSSEICALHLTHPSAHTPGAVGSRGFGALLKGLTSVVDNYCRSRDSNQQPQVTSPTLYPLGHDCPICIMKPISMQVCKPSSLSSHVYTLNACMRNNQSSGCRPKCCYNQSEFFPPHNYHLTIEYSIAVAHP